MSMTTVAMAGTRLRGRWLGLAALTISGLVLGLDITIWATGSAASGCCCSGSPPLASPRRLRAR